MHYTKIGIIVAMNSEFTLVSELLTEVKQAQFKHLHFCTGKIGNKEIVLLKSGIGKVNAAIATTSMIQEFAPDCIINTGVAGGIDKRLHVADIVVGQKTSYHDFYAGEVQNHQAELGFPDEIAADKDLLAALKSKLRYDKKFSFGLICTGDQFITNNDELMLIKKKRPCGLAVDMESNSIAQVCFYHKVPFISFRIISDTPWVDNHQQQYDNFWEEAPQKTFQLLNILIAEL
jgi:adenosylhomocysteine nucleosidase